MSGQPKAPFYLAVLLVIGGLVGFAVWRAFGPDEKPAPTDPGANGPAVQAPPMTQMEDPESAGITTVTEFELVQPEKLLPVKGKSTYEPLEDNTVKFALNVWAGWSPIIYANQGHQAKKIWKTPDGKEFKLQLALIDDPTVMLENYVNGTIHIGWATLDMLPLFMERMVDESGTPLENAFMPRVVQQVDWSNGGDGIVVRESVKTVADLRGKKIALARNSPSHYFLLAMLINAGVQPSEVEIVGTGNAFEAAAVFNQQKDIDACVSWAPDIYKLADVKGNRMLVDTGTANRLIGDVWFARADFARDHPGIMEALVRGIFDAMTELESQENKQKCAKMMAELYSIPETETIEMFADAYATNWGENYQFFVNQNYLMNFEHVWNNAYNMYRSSGVLRKPRVNFRNVMDNSIIKKLGEEEKYAKQTSQKRVFLPTVITDEQIEKGAFLTATHYIHFFPNSADPYHKVIRKVDDKDVEELYDPKVDAVLEQIGVQIEQFQRSRIVVEGHADASMKGQVDAQLVKELSQERAQEVVNALVDKYGLDPNRFQARGMGWDKPASPNNHAQNRRVEVRILPAEAQ